MYTYVAGKPTQLFKVYDVLTTTSTTATTTTTRPTTAGYYDYSLVIHVPPQRNAVGSKCARFVLQNGVSYIVVSLGNWVVHTW